MLKQTIVIGAFTALAFSGVAFAGGGLVVNATNNAEHSTAIGGNAVSKGNGRSNRSGPAIAGSIVMPAKFVSAQCNSFKRPRPIQFPV